MDSTKSRLTTQKVSILWPQDKGFEDARVNRVFNHRRPSRRPLAVINATSEEDVKEGINLANQLDCQVSVRSGGHSWGVWSVRENAILIDLGQLNSVSYNESTGIVSVGPATTGENINLFLRRKGRIFNGPHCPSVGVGGFLYLRPEKTLICIVYKEDLVGIVVDGDGQQNRLWGLTSSQPKDRQFIATKT